MKNDVLSPEEASKITEKVKIGVYIDGPNVFHGGLSVGWLIDYKKLDSFLRKKYNPIILSYYDCVGHERNKTNGTFLRDSSGNLIPRKSQLDFLKVLKALGYRTVCNPLKHIYGNPQKPKNDTDNNINWDVAKELKSWKKLILFSGDSDFERLVNEVLAINKPVHVFSFKNRLSHELKAKAFTPATSALFKFTELDTLKDILACPPKES